MIDSISFCVLRHGRDEKPFGRCVERILKQQVPRFEILVFGDRVEKSNVRFLSNAGWFENGEANKMRNLLCANAAADFIVLMDEGIELSDTWYETVKHVDYFDIIGSRITTDDNIRAIDWVYPVSLGSKRYPLPLRYDEWTVKAYVSGSLMALRRKVWEQIRFDETLRSDQGDDAEFCRRASEAGFRLGAVPAAAARYFWYGALRKNQVTFKESQRMVDTYREAFAAGRGALKTGNYSAAVRHFARAAAIAPDESAVLSLMGWGYYFSGKYDKAIVILDKAVAIDPASHHAFRGLGWAHHQRGSHEKAIAALTRALELVNPNHMDDWLETVRGISWSSYHSGHYDEAIRYFDEILAKAGRQDRGLLQDVYRGLAWSRYRKGSFSEAAACFKNALASVDPDQHELIQEIQRGLDAVAASAPHGGSGG